MDRPRCHIGLLAHNPADRELLEQAFGEVGYAVRAPDPMAADPGGWTDVDLVIADRASAGVHAEALRALKAASDPVFLPVLVLLPDRADAGPIVENGFDDVLRIPIRRAELVQRTRMMLRLRAQSQALLLQERKTADRLTRNLPIVFYRCLVNPDAGPEAGCPPVYVTSNIRRFFGYAPKECLGDPEWWRNGVHPQDAPAVLSEFLRLFEKGRLTHEYRFRHKDGSYRWVRDSLALERDNEGRPVAFWGLWIDISDRVAREQERELLLRIHRAIAGRKPGEGLAMALKQIGEVIPALDEGGLLLWTPGGEGFRWIGEWRRPEVEESALKGIQALYGASQTMPAGAGSYADAAVETGEPLYVPETAEGCYWGDEVRARYGWHTSFVLPLVLREDFRAMLVLQARRVDAFSSEIRRIFETLVPEFAAAVEVWYYETELRELNAALEERVRQRTRELELIYELGRRIGSAPDYAGLFRLMLTSMHRVVPYDVAAALLVLDGKPEAFVCLARPLTAEAQAQMDARMMEALEWMGEKPIGLEQVVRRVIEAPGFDAESDAVEELASVFEVPMFADARMVRLLFVGAEAADAFSEDQVRLLYTLAYQASESVSRLQAMRAEAQQRLERLVEYMPEGVCLLDEDRQVVVANPIARDFLCSLGVREGEAVLRLGGRDVEDLLAAGEEGKAVELAVDGPPPGVFEVRARQIQMEEGQSQMALVIRDVTQARAADERVHQQERLAAVGQLAAGIAHDFNNILMAVMGTAQMMGLREDLPETFQKDLEVIFTQGQRAANLVRQILDFSRKSMAERKPVDLVPFLKEEVKLLERTLPETIRITAVFGRGDYQVKANLTQIQQVLTNLAVNSRDAMPDGGALKIELGRLRLTPGEAPPVEEMPPGKWVALRVSDTGTGMSPEVLAHIYEPFFTTRGVGKGTGLGLSQVYGIVKQHGGFIGVESRVGKGTAFTIYLPALEEEGEAAVEGEGEEMPRGQGETVLVAEDEAQVRRVLRIILEGLGYRVLTAGNGQEALEVYGEYPEEVALVLSDVVMPEMGGIELYEALQERYGEAPPVVLLSGYPVGSGEGEALLPRGIAGYLQKPLDIRAAAQMIRQAIEGSR